MKKKYLLYFVLILFQITPLTESFSNSFPFNVPAINIVEFYYSNTGDNGDGVSNNIDICPDTPGGEEVNNRECSISVMTYIPDDNFEQILIDLGYDNVLDDYVLTSNLSAITVLDIPYKNISDLTGIEDFVNLKDLNCNENQISSLNLNNNLKLQSLSCKENQLNTLEIENCNLLTYLNCSTNNLNVLSIDNHLNLSRLHISNNNLNTIDLSQLPNLKDLYLENNQLTSLYSGANEKLETLIVSNNQISILDLSNNALLDYLKCSGNPILTLDLQANSLLQQLYASSTALTSLVLSNNLALIALECTDGQLTNISFSGNSNLYRIDCSNNELTSLETSAIPGVRTLDCSNNLLSNLKINHSLSYSLTMYAENNPNLYCIEVADTNTILSGNSIFIDPQADFNVNCSIDDDEDGVDNYMDICPNTSIGQTVDSNGCSNEQKEDNDNDGVMNGIDKCLGTIAGAEVNGFGCPLDEIITIPDEILKNALLNSNCVDTNGNGSPNLPVDTNGDGDIQYTEAEAVANLIFTSLINNYDYIIRNLEGLQYFINIVNLNFGSGICELNSSSHPTNFKFNTFSKLEYLKLNGSSIHISDLILDFSGLQNLRELNLDGVRGHGPDISEWIAYFANINLEGCINLETLSFSNAFLDIDFCQIPSLKKLDIHYLEGGEPDVFDLSCLVNLEWLDIDENMIKVLILKNGRVLDYLKMNSPMADYLEIDYVCIDDSPEEYNQIKSLVEDYTVVNSYCSFKPGGEFYSVSGKVKFDLDLNGCDENDPFYENLKFDVIGDSGISTFINSNNENFEMYLQEGNYIVAPVIENQANFTISPSSISISSSGPSIINQDFCIVPNGTINDLEINIIPVQQARPGFNTDYSVVIKNKGNATLSGSFELSFNDDLMDFISSDQTIESQSTNVLSWNFTDLLAFESRDILVTMNINTPEEAPPVNINDVLSFTTTISPVDGDLFPNDNVFTLNQTVVGSYDPNDKTCLEGDTITSDFVGEFLHYLVRFENTGTAEAVNIVVTDTIDSTKFDIGTLIPTSSSHNFITRINGEKIEFIFEGINLPFDDANNDGYLAFKIKSLPTLSVGETINNDADIYFDYNPEIKTNTASSVIIEPEPDDDNDGVSNESDLCPNTPSGETVDANGCSNSQIDDDNDGVMNNLDLCPNTLSEKTVNENGCSDSQLDDDNDGVMNDVDTCLDTPTGETVDANGCSDSQKDDDSDGVTNDIDQCPNTSTGKEVDSNGCSESQLDDDNDSVMNDVDLCPNTPTGETVNANGCMLLAFDNFTIETVSETCSNKDNGQIIINAQASYDYKATINGNNYDFTSNLSVENLSPGNYEICIEVTEQTSPYCYNIVIDEGTTISGKTSTTKNKTTVEISEGTAPYDVLVNGKEVLRTLSSSFDVVTNHGDLIEVKTAISCEGIYAKTVQLFDVITLYPNPTDGLFELTIPLNLEEVVIELYNYNSQLISTNTYPVVYGKVQFDLTDKSDGVYLVKVLVDHPITLKIIKN